MNKGMAAMAVAIITTAACILINKVGLGVVPPLMFAVWRTVFVVLGLFVILGAMNLGKSVFMIKLKNLKYMVLSGITGGYIGYLGVFYGQNLTSATNAGFLLRLTPLFAIILAVIILKEKLKISYLVSTCIMIIGTYFLITGGKVLFLTGDFVLILTAFFQGLSDIYAKKALYKLHPILASFWRNLFAFAPLLLTLFVLGFEVPDLQQWVWILASGSSLIIFWIAWHYVLKDWGVSKASFWSQLSPIFVSAGAFLFLGESLTLVQLAGGIIVLVGAALIARD